MPLVTIQTHTFTPSATNTFSLLRPVSAEVIVIQGKVSTNVSLDEAVTDKHRHITRAAGYNPIEGITLALNPGTYTIFAVYDDKILMNTNSEHTFYQYYSFTGDDNHIVWLTFQDVEMLN